MPPRIRPKPISDWVVRAAVEIRGDVQVARSHGLGAVEQTAAAAQIVVRAWLRGDSVS
jgi:hypothetical protein